MFRGAYTAIVTPFRDGVIDEEPFRALVRAQVDGGADGIVPCGTTGESATLSHEEHHRVIEIAIQEAAGRVPVIAGTGSNSTSETIELTRHAALAGADAALLITPYYNKPNQEGLYQHFKAVAEAVDLPLIVYNVPGRTAVNMLPETTARLSEIKNIVGIKDATGDLEQVSETIRLCRDDFNLLSGDDACTLPILAVGGHGVISVVSNIVPGDVARMCSSFMEGDIDGARSLHYKLLPLARSMFIDTSPAPVKTALSITTDGQVSSELRAPLTGLSDVNRGRLEAALREYGVI